MPDQTNIKQSAHQKLIDDIFAGIEANVIGGDEYIYENYDSWASMRKNSPQNVRDRLRIGQRQALKLEKEKWL